MKEATEEYIVNISLRQERVPPGKSVYREIQREGRSPTKVKDDEVVSFVGNVITYNPRDFCQFQDGGIETCKRYWVQYDQFGVFNDLMQIGEDSIRDMRADAYVKGVKAGENSGHSRGYLAGKEAKLNEVNYLWRFIGLRRRLIQSLFPNKFLEY